MGKPIVYCSGCGAGLREGSRDKIVHAEGQVFCATCRPEAAAPMPVPATTRRTSTSRVPRVSDTPRSFAIRKPKKAPVAIWAAVGGGILVVVVIAVLASKPSSSPPPPAPAPAPAPKPASVVPKPPSFEAELKAVDAAVAEAAGREDFRGALAALEAARKRRSEPEWTLPVDERMRDLNARVMSLFTSLKDQAAGSKPKLEELRGRVERWGRPDFAAEVGRLLAAFRPPWEGLFDGTSTGVLRNSSRQGWELRDGGLMRKGDNAAQTDREFSDGELRVGFRNMSDDTLFFAVRQGGDGNYRVAWAALKPLVRTGQRHDIVFVMNGGDVSATVDGRPLPLEKHGDPRSGCLQFNGPRLRVESVEFRPLP